VAEAERMVARAAADLQPLRDRAELRAATWQASSQALANAENWLKHGRPPGTVLEAVEVEPPKLNKNESPLDAISRHRLRARELKADAHRIRSALCTCSSRRMPSCSRRSRSSAKPNVF
jgi:hypothetical protein